MEQITKGGPKDWNTYNYVGFIFHAFDDALVNILHDTIFGCRFRIFLSNLIVPSQKSTTDIRKCIFVLKLINIYNNNFHRFLLIVVALLCFDDETETQR